MNCVFFFVIVIIFWTSKKASIFYFSGRKVNLVDTFGKGGERESKIQKFKVSSSFQKVSEKPKTKLKKNGHFYAKPILINSDFDYWYKCATLK